MKFEKRVPSTVLSISIVEGDWTETIAFQVNVEATSADVFCNVNSFNTTEF